MPAIRHFATCLIGQPRFTPCAALRVYADAAELIGTTGQTGMFLHHREQHQ